ncbi:MAG: cation transporter [Bacteroidetes bacterium]|nr:cation transporter [Bacteroidota bacterium]
MGAFLRKSLVWGFLGFMLAGGVFAQKQAVFKVSGPCMACGADRILGVVKGLDGVRSAKFDPNSSMLTVDFDPVAASVIDMQLELSLKGYDAGDFTRDAGASLPECARGGMRGDQANEEVEDLELDDIEGLETDTDWENPDAFEIVGSSDDDDLDLLNEELEEDEDLSTFVNGGDDDLIPGVDEDLEEDDSDE